MSDPTDIPWAPPETPGGLIKGGGIPKTTPTPVWHYWIAASLVLLLGVAGVIAVWVTAPTFLKSNSEKFASALAVSTFVPIVWALFYSDKKFALPRAADVLVQLPPLAAVGALSVLALTFYENNRIADDLTQACKAVDTQPSPGDRAVKLKEAMDLHARLQARFLHSATPIGDSCKGLLPTS